MDLSKAFDVIPLDLLLAKLKAYGVGEGSCALLKDYLSYLLKLGGHQKRSSSRERFRTNALNVFINDLFQHVKYVKLNAYADDHQIFSSNLDPLALQECICQEVNVTNQWYKNNGMIVNEPKHQFNIMRRFRKLINKETLLKLYKAFILPHFYYCSSVWHFCGARNTNKVGNLNTRILRFILQDYSCPYDILLSKVNLKSLFIRRHDYIM